MKRFPNLGREFSGVGLTPAEVLALVSKSLPSRSDHALRFRFISLEIQNSFIGTFPIYPDFSSATNTGDVPFGTPETIMENTLVRRDQFNITPQGIVHKPTDAAFTPYAGDPYSGTTRMGQLGNNPPNGSGFNSEDVQRIMRELWVDYVGRNPQLFNK